MVQMLGDRDIRKTIEKSIDKLHEDLNVKIDKGNPDRIHAVEACGCTRFAYYERKDPMPADNRSKISILLGAAMRHSLSNARGEYKIDSLSLEVNADLIMADEYVVRFEVVPALPEVPHPRDLLYLNACLFAFNKDDGILIYITAEGKTVEFSVTKNNRMFEETVRRARVLSTLLKDGKAPIVEPSELCLNCRYYERCYARKQEKDQSSGFILEEIFKRK
jgi:CRISPR-associated exonuclease Cas4